MKTRKILSFKKEGELYVCQMQYKEEVTGVAYLTKGEFLRAKLEEKLEGIDPSFPNPPTIDELAEVIRLAIEEDRWLESED